MQWLINIIAEKVIAEIGVPPCYIYRTGLTAWDFEGADLTKDDAWHDLDLSGIIPAGAKAAHMLVQIKSESVEARLFFKAKDEANDLNRNDIRSQVANVHIGSDAIVLLNANRIIQYRVGLAIWTYIFIGVKGWWL